MSQKELHRKVFELTLALYRVTDFFPKDEVLRRSIREKANEIFGRISEFNYAVAKNEIISILARIESMRGFLELARSLQFVKPINITILDREYGFLAAFFSHELSLHKEQDKSVKDNVKDTEQISDIQEELPTWSDFTEKREKNEPVPAVQKSEIPNAPVAMAQEKQVVKMDTLDTGTLSSISDVINDRQKAILDHLKQNDQAKISDFYSFFGDISSKTIQRDLLDLVSKNILKKDGEKRWTVYSLNDEE